LTALSTPEGTHEIEIDDVRAMNAQNVAVFVSLAECAWPAIRATRIPTVAALAYE
jgi:hypothetical protein